MRWVADAGAVVVVGGGGDTVVGFGATVVVVDVVVVGVVGAVVAVVDVGEVPTRTSTKLLLVLPAPSVARTVTRCEPSFSKVESTP
jgi:hypothetical protein